MSFYIGHINFFITLHTPNIVLAAVTLALISRGTYAIFTAMVLLASRPVFIALLGDARINTIFTRALHCTNFFCI